MSGIYLATAIDQAAEGSSNLRHSVVRWLTNTQGVSWVYDPKAAFDVGYAKPDPGIREINAAALAASDVLIALLPARTVSVGVPMEIERALALGVHVVVISDAPSWMLQDADIRLFGHWDSNSRAWLRGFLNGEPKRQQRAQQQTDMPVLLASDGAQLPTRGHADDAGLDLYVSEDATIPPGAFRDVSCGVHAELPDWCWGMITGRSSTLRRRGLMVSQGVIDAGYRGELFAGAFNLSGHDVHVKRGERLAQLILMENGTARVRPVVGTELQEGSRGHLGFGSTGA